MKKLIFITLILTLVLAMSAFASRTRVLTMGDNNTILLDDNNIWQFPSRINDYPGLAIGEIANDDVTQFGDPTIEIIVSRAAQWFCNQQYIRAGVQDRMRWKEDRDCWEKETNKLLATKI